jgi:prepilin-type N-terminal cleavage/methylation domain-containing protein
MTLKNPSERLDRILRRAAFTLMEMLVVVAIIVVLAGVGGAYLIGRLNEAKVDAARIKAREISQAVDQYYVDHSQYPPSLDVLLQRDQDGKGPYLKNVDAILNPVNNLPYSYDPSGQIGMSKGNTAPTPDVYITLPDGRVIGNFK